LSLQFQTAAQQCCNELDNFFCIELIGLLCIGGLLCMSLCCLVKRMLSKSDVIMCHTYVSDMGHTDEAGHVTLT